jgi:hypothetical protein
MSRPVIPVPARFRDDASKFVLRSGTRIVYADVGVAGMVERLCSDVARRTDLRLVPVLGDPPSDEQAMGASAVLGGNDRLGRAGRRLHLQCRGGLRRSGTQPSGPLVIRVSGRMRGSMPRG